MTKQIYLSRLEKGIKIIRTYDIMINGQQNYKTLPHYMKVFGDFCLDYLKYKVVDAMADINNIEEVNHMIAICEENSIQIAMIILEHADFIQSCKNAQYTDVAECMKMMPTTTKIIEEITKEIGE
ncbi:MAG: hypothetical protein U0L26_04280 [Cellulosilyticum sp.]|nr:hypothetical protein [Cellulosilyticum sp.]MEE1071599.1 hypothetical protein [Cellulosilyticum sp.]